MTKVRSRADKNRALVRSVAVHSPLFENDLLFLLKNIFLVLTEIPQMKVLAFYGLAAR